jgi:beta-1,4-mannooligosaccharide/beta-1,4-mannosyl-N-acetylglucosamine phosphorylase
MGAAILDAERPEIVRYRTQPYLLAPAAGYELAGDVPNVLFPCAALCDGERMAVYYGAADTVVGMAFGYVREILDFIKKNSL